MPKGGKPTLCVCENCSHSFKKKHQGNVTNRFCSRECRNIYNIKLKIGSGTYTRSSAYTFFKRFTDYVCDMCEIDTWEEKPITLQIDHIDGNNKNNVVENLRYLCPNCHSQTETWGYKNVSDEGRLRMVEAGRNRHIDYHS